MHTCGFVPFIFYFSAAAAVVVAAVVAVVVAVVVEDDITIFTHDWMVHDGLLANTPHDPSRTTRLLFDSGAQLAAVAAVRELENRLREGADHAAAQTLHSLVEAAGTACRTQHPAVDAGQRPAWEHTYCMPSLGASALLVTAASALSMQQPPQMVRPTRCVLVNQCWSIYTVHCVMRANSQFFSVCFPPLNWLLHEDGVTFGTWYRSPCTSTSWLCRRPLEGQCSNCTVTKADWERTSAGPATRCRDLIGRHARLCVRRSWRLLTRTAR